MRGMHRGDEVICRNKLSIWGSSHWLPLESPNPCNLHMGRVKLFLGGCAILIPGEEEAFPP